MRITTRHRNEALQPRNVVADDVCSLKGSAARAEAASSTQLHTLLCNCNCYAAKGDYLWNN